VRQDDTGGICHRKESGDGGKHSISVFEMIFGFHGILVKQGAYQGILHFRKLAKPPVFIRFIRKRTSPPASINRDG
jgi:hypothetical protein